MKLRRSELAKLSRDYDLDIGIVGCGCHLMHSSKVASSCVDPDDGQRFMRCQNMFVADNNVEYPQNVTTRHSHYNVSLRKWEVLSWLSIL